MSIKRFPPLVNLVFIALLLVVLILGISVVQEKQLIQQEAQNAQTKFTFVNNTNETIWVGTAGNPGFPAPNNGGFELPAHTTFDVTTANDWDGLFWGRTGCNFDSQGNGTCETGDCEGGLHCNGRYKTEGGTSLAEFGLKNWNGLDFYDVSLVDGANIPLFINTVNSSQPDPITADGCIDRPESSGPSGCISDVRNICPSELQVKNSSGQVVACQSACIAFKTDHYCCEGPYEPEGACNHADWPVDYAYNVFKKAQPYAYSYARDDQNSLFTCDSCNYRITFGLPSGSAPPIVNPSGPAVSSGPTPILTPNLGCLGSCPTITPTPTGPILSPITSPRIPGDIPPDISYSPWPSSFPNPSMPGNGGQPNNDFFSLILQFFLSIILWLFRIFT